MVLFQSTHPRGVRPRWSPGVEAVEEFQSTHPRGVRPERFRHSFQHKRFQSTHPRGVRLHILQNTEY